MVLCTKGAVFFSNERLDKGLQALGGGRLKGCMGLWLRV